MKTNSSINITDNLTNDQLLFKSLIYKFEKLVKCVLDIKGRKGLVFLHLLVYVTEPPSLINALLRKYCILSSVSYFYK